MGSSPVEAFVITTVWVDDGWAGTAIGASVGDGKTFGTDAFATIQEGINNVPSGGTVDVAPGFYQETVIVDKPVILTGSGCGSDTGSDTVIDPPGGAPDQVYGINIKSGASGSDQDHRTVIRSLRITGALQGVRFDSNATISHVALQDVTVVGCVDSVNSAGTGISLREQSTYEDILLSGVTVTGNDAGISGRQTGFNLNGLTIDNAAVTNNKVYGIQFYGGVSFTGLLISNSTLSGNNAGSTDKTTGDLTLTDFQGDATISNVNILSDQAGTGIRISGIDGSAPSGNIVLDNVTITGTQVGAALAISRYSDTANVIMSGVSLHSEAPAGLHLGTLGGTLNIGDTLFDGDYDTAGSGSGFTVSVPGCVVLGGHRGQSSYASATVNVDATSATYAGAGDWFAIEDSIQHRLDDASLGLVTWVDGNVFVTPASGSVQRGVDAVAAGGVVNLGPGTHDVTQVLIVKPLTLRGRGADQTIIDGGDASLTDSGTIRISNIASGDQIVVEGLTVRNFAVRSGDKTGLCVRGCYIPTIVRNCSFLGDGVANDLLEIGVWLYSNRTGGTVVVEDCEFAYMWNGVMFELPRAGGSIVGNEFHDLHSLIVGGTPLIEPRGAYALTYDGSPNDVSEPLSINNNRFYDYCGSGVTVLAYQVTSGAGCARFTDVEVLDNFIDCIGSGPEPRHVGVRFYNGGATPEAAALGGVHNATIAGNYFGAGGSDSRGIWLLGPNNGLTITGNIFAGVNRGLSLEEVSVGAGFAVGTEAHENIFRGNTLAVSNGSADPAHVVNATGNWWGHAYGPQHATANPGGMGDPVSDNVVFDPWDAGTVVLSAPRFAPIGSTQTVSARLTLADGTLIPVPLEASFATSHGTVTSPVTTVDGLATTQWVTGTAPALVRLSTEIAGALSQVGVSLYDPTPPPPPAGSTGGFSQDSDCGVVTVVVPEDVYGEPVILTIAPTVSVPPTGGNPSLGVFDVEIVTAADGTGVEELDQALTIIFHFTPESLAGAGITDPSQLLIWYWDTEADPPCWVALPTVIDLVAGTASVTVHHLTTFAAMVVPGFPALTDTAGHWAETDILRLASLGAVSGFDDGTFRPEQAVTRAQFAKFLAVSLGLAEGAALPGGFSDGATVPTWAKPYVAACVREGILTGSQGLLRPNDSISRAEAAAMIIRALNIAPAQSSGALVLAFSDAATVPDWATGFVGEAVGRGLITGLPSNLFDPAGILTRAQAVTILSRALDIE